jgi:hypothetical protein
LKVEECAEEHGVMWPAKRCTEASVKLHEAIKAYETSWHEDIPMLWCSASTIYVEHEENI